MINCFPFFLGCASFALKYLMILLCSPLRPVRVATADSLQVALVTYSQNILDEESADSEERIEKCSNLLQDIDWGNEPMKKLKEVRNEICSLVNVKPPVATVVT